MYNEDLYFEKCEEISNIADASKEATDALIRVMAQMLFDRGNAELAEEIKEQLSDDCKEIL